MTAPNEITIATLHLPLDVRLLVDLCLALDDAARRHGLETFLCAEGQPSDRPLLVARRRAA